MRKLRNRLKRTVGTTLSGNDEFTSSSLASTSKFLIDPNDSRRGGALVIRLVYASCQRRIRNRNCWRTVPQPGMLASRAAMAKWVDCAKHRC